MSSSFSSTLSSSLADLFVPDALETVVCSADSPVVFSLKLGEFAVAVELFWLFVGGNEPEVNDGGLGTAVSSLLPWKEGLAGLLDKNCGGLDKALGLEKLCGFGNPAPEEYDALVNVDWDGDDDSDFPKKVGGFDNPDLYTGGLASDGDALGDSDFMSLR